MKSEQLPPYGYMNAGLQWEIDIRRLPDTFMVHGRIATPDEWATFLNNLIDEIAGFLWPRYDYAQQSWVGGAVAQMVALTIADLDLMQADPLNKLILASPAVGSRPLPNTHKAIFLREDESKTDDMESYLVSATPEIRTRVDTAFRSTLGKLGPSILRFKEAFQRPRPYQVAFMSGRPFSYEWAKSAVTPSLMSGHSIQGVIGSCGAYLALRRDLETAPGAVLGLQQYGTDFGDRRVFAGVHYPSDNIASWFIALRLCDHLFGSAGQVVKDFLVQAITGCSHVYAALRKTTDDDKKSVFTEPMRQLTVELRRPAQKQEGE